MKGGVSELGLEKDEEGGCVLRREGVVLACVGGNAYDGWAECRVGWRRQVWVGWKKADQRRRK